MSCAKFYSALSSTAYLIALKWVRMASEVGVF